MAANLRKHNFKFGFEEGQFESEASMTRASAAKKSLYEYTKASNVDNFEWRKQQIVRNRNSNIQWGLKREDATAVERIAGKSAQPNAKAVLIGQAGINQNTRYNVEKGGTTRTIDSSRTQ